MNVEGMPDLFDDDSMPPLQAVSDSSDDELDDDDDDYGSQPSLRTVSDSDEDDNSSDDLPVAPANSAPQQALSPFAVRDFVMSVVAAQMRQDIIVDEQRAQILLNGLEPVSDALLSRYEKFRGTDGVVTCAICCEDLLSSPEDWLPQDSESVTENASLSKELPLHTQHHPILSFPCIHLFHWHCLAPWLARKTTCPTCRFDIDSRSLTSLFPGSWTPPDAPSLSEWLEDQEAILKGEPSRLRRPRAEHFN